MKLGYVVIYVEDVAKTMDFYQQAFPFKEKLRYENEGRIDYGELDTGDATLSFASHQIGDFNLQGKYEKVSAHGNPVGQELVFVTDDVAGAYARAIGAGAMAIAAPAEKPWGQTVAFLRAKEGTLIEICSPLVAV